LAQVEQAKININDCKLNAPFTGQIARVHVIPGGYVFPGQAVVTLQMMDPLKVDIAISPARDAQINYNDLVRVYAPTGDVLEGYVYLKDTFADPATRTFLVTLLVRNKRIRVGVPDEMEGKGIAECRNLWKLDKPDIDGPGNYYAEVKAIHQDDQGYFVWKVENLTQAQLFEDFDPVLTVKKVRVTPGEGRVPVLQVFTFRELTDFGELDPTTDIIAGGITGKVADGDKMLLVRERWIGRPGDVVGVGLKGEATPRGFYVPQEAIQFDGQKHFLAVAELAGDAHQVVHVPVKPAETVGRLQRISATSGAQLAEGMKVIVDGAHYVQPQDKVNPVDEIEVSP
jgi:multidrug efflux pump subunit AcrA (membrane-fusion protein)